MNARFVPVLLVLLIVGACSEKHKEPDFRNANWGITSEQVKMVENAKLVMDNGKMLSYDGTVGGIPCQIVYVFVRNQLIESHYFLKAEHKSDNTFIQDYDKLKSTLTEKYGTPALDDATWKNDVYKGNNDKVGLALRSGHLTLAAEWGTPSTEVWLFLTGDNSQIKLSLKYVSKELGKLQEEEKNGETETELKANEF